MRASLLPNGNLVGTGEASRQSLSQSPVLGRHGNKQRGVREMGEKSQREAGRCTIISDPVTCSGRDTQPCGHPVCFTDQRTQSLLSSSVPLTQTRSTSPHTHTQAHTLPPTHTQPHTPSHTPHTLLTQPHSPTLIRTYSSHTLIHHLHTPHTLHKHIHSSHPHTPSHLHTLTPSHTHTLHTLTRTHPHTLLTCTHTHTYTHTSTEPTGAKTQETWGPRGSAHTPGTWSLWEQPRVPAGVSRWTFHTLGATGTLEAP